MIVEAALTALSLAGLAVFYWEETKSAATSVRSFLYLRMRGIRLKREEMRKTANAAESAADMEGTTFTEAMRRLLQATVGYGGKRAAGIFIFFSAALGFAAFSVLRCRIAFWLAFAAAAAAFSTPFIALMCRLKSTRVENSKEGDVMITELLDNYRMNYFNMQQAVEVTALSVKEAPRSRKLLFNLSKGLNTASGEGEIKELLSDFRFAIGTSWAGVLTDNMYFALTSGIRVAEALEDLIKTVEKAKKIEEFSGRENNESRLMLKYMAPCCYLLTVVAGIKYFGLSPEEFVKYQFATETGMAWFMISALTYGAGTAARALLSRNKLDI